MKTLSIVIVFVMNALLVGRGTAQPASGSLVERIGNTLAYRFEQACQLEEQGRLAEAEAIYGELVDLHEAADPLAAQTRLRLAILREKQGHAAAAEALYLQVVDRFAHIPWAVQDAQAALVRLRSTRAASPVARDPFKSNKPSLAAISSSKRLVSIELKDASLASVKRLFEQLLKVPLDLDPALADRTVTFVARNMPLGQVVGQVAEQVNAQLVATRLGYRLEAKASPPGPDLAPAEMEPDQPRGLKRMTLMKTIRARYTDLKPCYAGQSGKQDTRLQVRMVIGTDGTVREAQVTGSAAHAGPKSLYRCLEAKVAAWRFPKPREGELTTRFSLNFNFVNR